MKGTGKNIFEMHEPHPCSFHSICADSVNAPHLVVLSGLESGRNESVLTGSDSTSALEILFCVTLNSKGADGGQKKGPLIALRMTHRLSTFSSSSALATPAAALQCRSRV